MTGVDDNIESGVDNDDKGSDVANDDDDISGADDVADADLDDKNVEKLLIMTMTGDDIDDSGVDTDDYKSVFFPTHSNNYA